MFVSPSYAKKNHLESKSEFVIIGGPLNKAKLTLVDPSEASEPIDVNDVDYKNTFGSSINIYNPHSKIFLSFAKSKPGSNGKRITMLVSGPSGCGKTTFTINYMNVFRFQHPNPETHPIYFITAISDDPRLAKVKGCNVVNVYDPEAIEAIFINQESKLSTHQDLFGQSKLNNALVVFDDVEGIDKNLRDILEGLISDIMKFGRHNNCSLIWSRHVLNSNNRLIQESLSEIMYIVLFKADSYKKLSYFCDKYLAQGKELVKYIRKDSGSRFTLIHNRCPFFIMTDSFLHVIND